VVENRKMANLTFKKSPQTIKILLRELKKEGKLHKE